MCFLAEANLSQIIRRAEGQVDAGEFRAHLNDRIRGIFGGGMFETATLDSDRGRTDQSGRALGAPGHRELVSCI